MHHVILIQAVNNFLGGQSELVYISHKKNIYTRAGKL